MKRVSKRKKRKERREKREEEIFQGYSGRLFF
jgi:hypothetical protein